MSRFRFSKFRVTSAFGAGVLLLVVAAGLYLLTLDNGLRPEELVGGDLITHQYAQVEARPSNAPGYPLYTMGGWLWFHLGRPLLGWALNPIEILSLYSTLWGLGSLLILYLILLRVTSHQWFIALLLAAFYGTTFFFWYYSVTTEQYTSAVFQTVLVILLALKWDQRPRDSLLLGLAFVSGTMLANMVTTLFILPPLLWFIFFRKEQLGSDQRSILFSYLRKPRLMLQGIGLALLPLLSYAYVYIRGAQHPEWRGAGEWSSTWDWFVQFLTIQQGRDELGWGLTVQNVVTEEFPALMWQELTWPIFLGGLVGLAFLQRRRALFLYSTLIIYFIFSWGYRQGNWFQVIIPAYPIIIIGCAAGLKKLAEWIDEKWAAIRYRSLAAQAVVIIFLMGLLSYRFTASLPEANQHGQADDTGLDPGWAILADRPAPPAVISTTFEEQVALQYLSTIWKDASQIYPSKPGDLNLPAGVSHDEYRNYISRQAATTALEAIQSGQAAPQAAGEQLIALPPEPSTQMPADAVPLDVKFGDQLTLIGWEQLETDYPLPKDVARRLARANWQLALYWQAPTSLSKDYTVSVRPLVGGQLITVAGENLIQDHQPVWGLYPTSLWRPKELVRDVYALSLPPGVKPDTVQIVVYRVTDTGFENLAETTLELQAGNQPEQDTATRR